MTGSNILNVLYENHKLGDRDAEFYYKKYELFYIYKQNNFKKWIIY